MTKPIRIYGDPVLEQLCADVEDFASSETKNIIRDLLDTCHAANGAGLAAPQIGVLKRIAVVRTEFDRDDVDGYIVLINPRLTSQGGRSEEQEGCLSVPGHRDQVTRPNIVTVDYQNELGEIKSIRGTGLVARALIHEIDHLDGRLFIHSFGSAYCAAVKEWLGRQMEKPIEQTADSTASHLALEAPAVPEADSQEAYEPFEASFVQAAESEGSLNDPPSTEMANREIDS